MRNVFSYRNPFSCKNVQTDHDFKHVSSDVDVTVNQLNNIFLVIHHAKYGIRRAQIISRTILLKYIFITETCVMT